MSWVKSFNHLGTIQSLIYPPMFFTKISIRLTHGKLEGWIIFADSISLIKLASFCLNRGNTFRKRCAIGCEFPKSMSHIARRAADGKALPFPVTRCHFSILSVAADPPLRECSHLVREPVYPLLIFSGEESTFRMNAHT